MYRGAAGEVAAQAHTETAKRSVTKLLGVDPIDDRNGVRIVARERFSELVGISFVFAGVVIREHGSDFIELVKDLGDDDDIAMAGEVCRGPCDGSSDLEDLRVEDYRRKVTLSCRTKSVASHRARCSVEIYLEVSNSHGQGNRDFK